MQGIEIYAELSSYRFIPGERIYHNVRVTLVDTLTNKCALLESLLIVVQDKECTEEAEAEAKAKVKARAKNWIIVRNPKKINSKKERHEVVGSEVHMELAGRKYLIDEFFMRTLLQKRVPERKQVNHFSVV